MKSAAKVAMCGICSALSVLVLFLGGIMTVFAYVAPMVTGIIMILLVSTFGYKSAWTTYIATSLLSFFLVPDKECMLMYVCFFGYYTIVREYLSKIKQSWISWIIKFLLFNISLVLANVILFYVFGIPFLAVDESKWLILLFALVMNILFIIYERLLRVMEMVYKLKIEKRVKKFIK